MIVVYRIKQQLYFIYIVIIFKYNDIDINIDNIKNTFTMYVNMCINNQIN